MGSAGGIGDGDWAVQSVHTEAKRGSLPKLEERRGGNGDGDGDGNSTSGDAEDPRASGKRRRSIRQRNNTRTPRTGDVGGGGPSSPSSSTGGNESRRAGLGDREGREFASRKGGVGVGTGREATAHGKDGGDEELEMSRTNLSPSSVSTSASVAARIEVEGGSVGSGRARPPRLDL